MQTILVTGNRGYIGSVLVPLLAQKYTVLGLDTEFYDDSCLLYPETPAEQKFIRKDIRDITEEDVEGVDAVIHLAALSNDPLSFLDPQLTEDINFQATVRLAKLAKATGAQRFVYASSQSMYGRSTEDKELTEDDEKHPVTPYGITKFKSEQELRKLNDSNFCTVSFRPSTVFGPSPKLRLDIVFNSLLSTAYSKKSVEIKSDGTPWRPVIHIRDVCQAFKAGIEAPTNLVAGKSFNVGMPNGNFQVRELAEEAQAAVPGSQLAFLNEVNTADERTYKISFAKIKNELFDYFNPTGTLEQGATELIQAFKKANLTDEDCKGRKFIRLKQLEYLLQNNKISQDLRWL